MDERTWLEHMFDSTAGLRQGRIGTGPLSDPRRRVLDVPKRCDWGSVEDPLYVAYHDEEWGVPSHENRHLFEMLVLEGAQAGLSFTVLRQQHDCPDRYPRRVGVPAKRPLWPVPRETSL